MGAFNIVFLIYWSYIYQLEEFDSSPVGTNKNRENEKS